MSIPFEMPQEHGAWGILAAPFLSAAAIAGNWNLPLLLAAVCVLSTFLLRGSLEARATKLARAGDGQAAGARGLFSAWHLLLAGFGVAAAGALVLYYGRYELVWIAVVGLALFGVQQALGRAHNSSGQEKRSLPAELAGVGLLTLTAPVAWIAARGSLLAAGPLGSAGDAAAGAQAWLLNLVFFLGGILYVKYRVRGLLAHRDFVGLRERLAFAAPVVLYHSGLLVLLSAWVWLSAWGFLARDTWVRPLLIALAFLPGITRAMALVVQLGRRFPIRRLGWTEMLHAALFAALLALAFQINR